MDQPDLWAQIVGIILENGLAGVAIIALVWDRRELKREVDKKDTRLGKMHDASLEREKESAVQAAIITEALRRIEGKF